MMNDISWMLYWADVLPGISSLITVPSVILIVLVALAALVSLMAGGLDDVCDTFDKLRPARWFFIAWGALLLSVQFIPSRDTFYAIAASEMGEQALKSPLATKAGKALEKWLDDQLDEEKEPSK